MYIIEEGTRNLHCGCQTRDVVYHVTYFTWKLKFTLAACPSPGHLITLARPTETS